MNLKYFQSLHICVPNTLGGHHCSACFTAVAFFMPFLDRDNVVLFVTVQNNIKKIRTFLLFL